MASASIENSASPRPPWRAAAIVAGLAAAWLLPISRAWQIAPDLGHAWVVPALMAYLWWERWHERPIGRVTATPHASGWLLAALLIGAHFLVRLFLTPYPVWPAALVLFTAIIAGSALIGAWLLGGMPAVRWVAGPLILLLAVLPAPTVLELHIIAPLREIMAAVAAEVCNLLGRPAMASGTSVRLAASWVGIDEACGGIRSLQACLMIALFFGEWYRFSVMRRLALVVAGVAAAVLGNFSRVVFLSLRAEGGAAAIDSAHDAAGWVAMGASVLLTGWLACRWAGYRLPAARAARPSVSPQPAAPAWRWCAIVVIGFLVSETAIRAWYLFGARARAEVPQWTAKLPESLPTFRREPLSAAAREMLRPDAFIAGTWPLGRDVLASAYYVEWHRGQTARTAPFLHNPTVCLPFAGCELVETLTPLSVPWAHGEITFFAYKFRRLGEHIIVAFTIWDPSRGSLLVRPQTESWSSWFTVRWDDVRAAREHQPAQMLAVALPWEEGGQAPLNRVLIDLIQSSAR